MRRHIASLTLSDQLAPYYSDVIINAMTSPVMSISVVCSTVCSGADQTKYQSSASLAFVGGTGEFPAQRVSNMQNVSIWWRHHDTSHCYCFGTESGIHINSYPPDKMAAISQTTYSNACSQMKNFVFWFEFHWTLFLRAQLTIFQHWFR